jgi:hypothetical protein
MPSATEGEPGPPAAAFVIYLRSQQTLVIRADGSEVDRFLDGLWIPAPGSAVRYGELKEDPRDPDAMLLSVCVDGDDACDPDVPRLLAFADGPRLLDDEGEPCPCVYVGGISDDPTFDYEGEDTDEDDVGGEDEDACRVEPGESPGPLALLAVQGGTVFVEDAAYNGRCDAGMPVWEAWSDAIAASPSYAPRPMTAPRPSTCADAGVYGMDYDNAPESVDRCQESVEYPWLASGRRARISVEYAVNGVSLCCAVTEPLAQDNCPSAVDPCGELRASDNPEDADDYWVATNGSAALVRREDGLEVIVRATGSRFAVELPPKAKIIGVHFVPDAAGYLDAIGPTPKWRFTSPDDLAESSAFEHTADYASLAQQLVAAKQLDRARRILLLGLRHEQQDATDGFGTDYPQRIALLDLLAGIAAAQGRPDEAEVFRKRAQLLREHEGTSLLLRRDRASMPPGT